MQKKLFAVFGPVIAAFALIAVLFASAHRMDICNPEIIKRASSSMSENILRGDAIKNQALSEKQYIPFFGSSELSRISPFHPSVLAKKYHRDYRPFLLGAPGTQSLSQYMVMRSAGETLKNKKVIFIISPQWFVKNGVNTEYFNLFYSKLQTYDWLFSLKQITPADRYLARRLVSFSIVKKNNTLSRILKTIIKGKTPTADSLDQLRIQWDMLKREDKVFSSIGLKDRQKQIDHAVNALPDHYQEAELLNLANKIGRKETTNNPFGLKNEFYTHRIKSQLPKLNQSQKNWDYRFSKEFSDFQLVLDQLARNHTEALFILPPVNEKWSNYTGLSQKMLQEFAKKIKFQLRSQGFSHIADFTNQGGTNYFMEDTIHLGWKGWLAADQKIKPFLEQKQRPSLYRLNPSFYSEKWQEQDPKYLK